MGNNAGSFFESKPLHNAILMNHSAGNIRFFLKLGANVNKQDSNGNTPLHLAVALRKRQIVQTLVEAGADLSVANVHGLTPWNLALASKPRDVEIIRMLVRPADSDDDN